MQDKYGQQNITLTIAQAGIMAALTAVATALVQVYIPATRGYFNFGDIIIFVSALTFGIGRTAGWLAQWQEMLTDPDQKISRPRQVYLGPGQRNWVPTIDRK